MYNKGETVNWCVNHGTEICKNDISFKGFNNVESEKYNKGK